MKQLTSTRSNPTARRVFSGLIAATALVAVQLWTATPARAGHTVTITHLPPPLSVAGSDVRLVVAVDGCWMFCSSIRLETTYRTGDGRTQVINKNLGSFGPQSAVVAIPGRHVAKPAISYFLQASQDYCLVFDVCHSAEVRLPETGSYMVRVE